MLAARYHRLCDTATEIVLYGMVIFSPWAFGTTQRWSIWTMNVLGYALGVVWLGKLGLRRWGGYSVARWDRHDAAGTAGEMGRLCVRALAWLTVFLLAYCLVSALNARADYVHLLRNFEYYDCIRWLPHTYDRSYTWLVFWQYLAMALSFWATRDWLLGMTREERGRFASEGPAKQGTGSETPPQTGPSANSAGRLESFRYEFAIPDRLRRLLWVLCVNAAVLAIVGVLQRLSGTSRLLWLVQPHINTGAEAQFGPFAYRSNAAQYLNLIWPVCVAFWWQLHQQHKRSASSGGRVGGSPHVLLLPCAVLAAGTPMITTSRGGALVAVASLIGVALVLVVANRAHRWQTQAGWVGLLGLMVLFGGYLGWDSLAPRLTRVFDDQLGNRLEIFENTRQIARDYPLFGTGPNSFSAVYQLYRKDPQQVWHAYLHNDWLEFRVTFGWVGLVPMLISLALLLGKWWAPPGIAVHWLLPGFTLVGLIGCLAHAAFDFPFQVYSVAFLFLLLSSVLFCVRRK